MQKLIQELIFRNEVLFWFGAANLFLAVLFLALIKIYPLEVSGVNAWFKPVKFALSIGIYSLTMAWLMHDLGSFSTKPFINWSIVILLGLEILYIGIQASRGQQSHFNVSTSFYSGMYAFMAFAATGISLITANIGILYFTHDFPELPDYYVWAVRLGLLLFVVFSLEGYVMGSRMSHTIGGADGDHGIAFLGWSLKYGDPRIAHFIGMHALQVLPLMAYYILKDVRLTFLAFCIYSFLAIYVLVQALQAKPFIQG